MKMGILKKLTKKRSRRAVSPVIATVILVAIAITVAVAVAYWMGGIAGTYTRFEQVELQNAVVTAHNSPSDWNITLTLKNTGTRDTTLTSVFINDMEVDTYGVSAPYTFAAEWATSMTETQVVKSGESLLVNIYIAHDKPGETLSSGTTVNIKIHSAGGMDFLRLVELI